TVKAAILNELLGRSDAKGDDLAAQYAFDPSFVVRQTIAAHLTDLKNRESLFALLSQDPVTDVKFQAYFSMVSSPSDIRAQVIQAMASPASDDRRAAAIAIHASSWADREDLLWRLYGSSPDVRYVHVREECVADLSDLVGSPSAVQKLLTVLAS